ncbi:hypothetical protein B5X24_HaOG210689 [Helicoverpa armigera]|uniref:DUF4758 domain-containing protein n=1 Tax=Helicoverpa armigera TaxID=29058 RepID=A0A2W1BJ29_HELAM|nr:hypothetical protein B5X24_HaOG210689 [Helicoverpa armigera]
MRLFVLNCLLLASVALATPNGREKRDLAYLKNLITSAIFGSQKINIQQSSVVKTESDYKLFRLPGYEDVMVKVSPKKTVAKEFVYPPVKPVNLNAFGSVVGTKSDDDTLVAVKGVDNLLSTGILYGGPNNLMKETIAPMFPALNKVKYVAKEKIEAAPVIETVPQPPALTEVTQPFVEEKVEFKVPFEQKYSYKQMKNHEPMITYTAHNNPNEELVETVKTKSELPMCIKQRIDEAIVLGANPYMLAPVQEIYQEQTAPVVDISYGQGEQYFYVPQPSVEERFTERFSAGAAFGVFPEMFRPSKDGPVRHNVKPMKIQSINRRPITSNSDKAPNSEVKISATKEKVNDQNKQVTVFSNTGNKVDIAQTLGPLPQYVVHSSKKQLSVPKEKEVNQMKPVQIAASKDSVANSKIPDTVYQNQRNPNTGKVLQQSKDWRTNLKTNVKQYIVVPNATSEGLRKTIELAVDGLHTNTVTAKPQIAVRPAVISGTKRPKVSVLRENKPVVSKENPVAAPKVKQYSYHQKHADGSSTNIKGNKQGVSVNIKPKYSNVGRGDIPDQK